MQLPLYNAILAKCKRDAGKFFVVKIKKRSDCPISCSLDVWGDKWSLIIVRDLMLSGPRTYGDFLKSEEKIATNILASRLQMLKENDVIVRFVRPEIKTKALYKLTQKGIDLLPLMIEINLWADKYFTISAERKAVLKQVEKGKDVFIKTQMSELRKIM